MIGKKKKLSKKEFQEDQLVTSFYKSQDFFQKNQGAKIVFYSFVPPIIFYFIENEWRTSIKHKCRNLVDKMPHSCW